MLGSSVDTTVHLRKFGRKLIAVPNVNSQLSLTKIVNVSPPCL